MDEKWEIGEEAPFQTLIEHLERGETVQLTRHGAVIGKVVPARTAGERKRAHEAVAAIRELRKNFRSGGGETIKDLINAGRRF